MLIYESLGWTEDIGEANEFYQTLPSGWRAPFKLVGRFEELIWTVEKVGVTREGGTLLRRVTREGSHRIMHRLDSKVSGGVTIELWIVEYDPPVYWKFGWASYWSYAPHIRQNTYLVPASAGTGVPIVQKKWWLG